MLVDELDSDVVPAKGSGHVILPLDEVRAERAPRRDFGRLTALKRSIATEGQLAPIGVDEDNRLIFGARRLEAMRLLRSATIWCVRPTAERNVFELFAADELDLCRKPMRLSEMVRVARRLYEVDAPNAALRRVERNRRNMIRRYHPEVEPLPDDNNWRRDQVATLVGFGTDQQYYRAGVVLDAAESLEPPAAVREVAETMCARMDSGAISLGTAFRLVKQAKDEFAERGLVSSVDDDSPRRKSDHRKTLGNLSGQLAGLAIVADGITALSDTVTAEEAGRLTSGLTASLRSLYRINKMLKERSTL